MKKHWLFTTLAVLLLCVLCFTLFPTEAKAAGVDDLTFTLNSDGQSYAVTDCSTSASGALEIPAIYNGKPVTSIGYSAFHWCVSMTGITIPDSVTSIDSSAFSDCSGLTGIWVSENNPNYSSDTNGVLFDKEQTTLICTPGGISGTYAIPDSVTSIGGYAFYNCCRGLTSIAIPDSVTSIGGYAFYNCRGLTSITIPDSVTSIGGCAFAYCSSLTGIWVSENNPNYSSDTNGVLFDKEQTTLICTPGGISGTYAIPDSVTSIEDVAFSGCSGLTSITIPDGVTSIGGYTFSGCSGLTSITIPDGVTSIGDAAFRDCSSLTSITIPDSVTSIGRRAFYNCSSLRDVYYGGTEAQWVQISIGSINGDLTSATIHFGSAGVMKITTQPKTAKVKVGATAKFTVKASGEGLKYQWQSSSNGKTWKNCSSSSAKKATFTFTSKTRHSSNYYRCRVTDAAGNTVYTDAVRLYVLGVTTQPKTQKVEAGEKVKFTVAATGAGKTYQWQVSTDGKTWKNCSSSSAKKATFTFTGKTSHSSNYYRCRIKDNAGNTVYTDAVRLYVLGIKEQPVSKTVTKGKTAKFTVEATGASKVYQWQVSTDGGKTWKNCSSSSAKKATFTFTSKTSHNGNYYRCRVKDNGGNTVYTAKVKLTVKK